MSNQTQLSNSSTELQYQLSYWEKDSFFSNIDVVIIGSGIVGLSAAIRLKELDKKLNLLIVERGSLPIGASTRNAGFACFGSMTELLDDLNSHNETEVWDLVAKRWEGLQKLRKRCGDKNLYYLEYGGYELFRKEDMNSFEQCADALSDFNKKAVEITGLKNVYSLKNEIIEQSGFQHINKIICNKAEGQIHTGQMMATLLKKAHSLGVNIMNGISIKNIITHSDEVSLETENGYHFTAQKAIIATNGFAKKMLPQIAVEPARNQVLITSPIKNIKIKGCFHYEQGYYYFRNIDQRILLGGGRNLAKQEETTSTFGTSELIRNALIELLKNVILPEQKFQIEQWWSGIMGVGIQKNPIVQKLNERVAISVRLGGMGVAIGSTIGEQAAELIY